MKYRRKEKRREKKKEEARVSEMFQGKSHSFQNYKSENNIQKLYISTYPDLERVQIPRISKKKKEKKRSKDRIQFEDSKSTSILL